MALKYKHTLLLVDDEESITKSLYRLFRREGYEIHIENSGQGGLQKIKDAEKPFSLIVSDQRMPGMTGTQFLEKSKELCPDAIRFLLTGYSDMDTVVEGINKGAIHRYLTKPWNNEEMLTHIRQSLMQYELVIENRRLMALTAKQNKELGELNKNLEQKVQERTEELNHKNEELSRLNKELEQNLYNTVRAFASLLERFSPAVACHGRRVSNYSRELARQLKLSKKEAIQLEIAALLHDVGKLGFPEKLMCHTSGELTGEDRTRMRGHPMEGQTIVQFISKLDYVAGLIRSHHEQIDGKGYPDRLEGDQIPFGSKVIAVADAYDNIVNLNAGEASCLERYMKENRISHNQMTQRSERKNFAAYYLEASTPNRFDPNVVKVMQELIRSSSFDQDADKPGARANMKEQSLTIDQLKKGMVLSRSIYTAKGLFLLPYDTELTMDNIQKLVSINKNEPIPDLIYVLKR